jgi:hypothetical protein
MCVVQPGDITPALLHSVSLPLLLHLAIPFSQRTEGNSDTTDSISSETNLGEIITDTFTTTMRWRQLDFCSATVHATVHATHGMPLRLITFVVWCEV